MSETAKDMAKFLRGLLNADREASLLGTPMIPLHRDTIAEIQNLLEKAK